MPISEANSRRLSCGNWFLLWLLVVFVPMTGMAMPLGQVIPASVDLLQITAASTARGDSKLLLQMSPAGDDWVAVGEGGLILRSRDEGLTWAQVDSPVSVMLTAVTMADTRHGWAVGHDGVILSTDDGGSHWQRQFDGRDANAQVVVAARQTLDALGVDPSNSQDAGFHLAQAQDRLADAEAAQQAGPSRPLFGVAALSSQVALAAGAFGQLFETRNGGNRWSYIGDRLDNPDGLHLNRIQLLPSGDLWIAGEGGHLFRSRDGGRVWETIDLGYAGHLYGVVGGTHTRTVIAYGFNGTVFRSEDSGTNWSPVPMPLNQTLVDAVSSRGQVLLLCQDGSLMTSTDDGRQFSMVGRLPGEYLSALQLHKGWLLGVGAKGVSRMTLSDLNKEI